MHPDSIPGEGPTSPSITNLPPAGREEMLAQEGLDGSAHWGEAKRWGHGPDDAIAVSGDATESIEERGFLLDGGWTAVSIKGDGGGGGLTSHRGPLNGDEYVDHERLVALVEGALGFTFDDVHAVYRQGPLSDTQRELRGRIDARLLALSRSGANMALLGRVLGFHVNESGACEAVNNALARARGTEAVAA